MLVSGTRCASSGRRGERGFTLAEVIVALAVLSIATSIMVSMLGRATVMSRYSRNQAVATGVARDVLSSIQSFPDAVKWPSIADLQDGALKEALLLDSAGGVGRVPIPSYLPVDPKAKERELVFHDKFAWKIYARLPRPDAAYVEVSATVTWHESGRNKALTLTTALPRSAIEGTP